jgi:hypothetical protein
MGLEAAGAAGQVQCVESRAFVPLILSGLSYPLCLRSGLNRTIPYLSLLFTLSLSIPTDSFLIHPSLSLPLRFLHLSLPVSLPHYRYAVRHYVTRVMRAWFTVAAAQREKHEVECYAF